MIVQTSPVCVRAYLGSELSRDAKKKNVKNVSCAEIFFFEQDYIMAHSTPDNEAQEA